MESKNYWVIHARLNTAINTEDAEAGNVHYHISCYTKLKNDARAEKSKSSHAKRGSPVGCTYDPLVIAQLVAFVEFNHSAFKLAELRKLYDRRLNQLVSDWIGVYVHQKRFKENISEKLGPDWSVYSEGRDVYVSHKKVIGAALAQNVNLQVSEDEAKKIIDVGIMLRRYILLQQMPFDGSFNSSCPSEPVAKPLLILLEVLIQASKSIQENVEEDQASNSARIRVACPIYQLIYSNATKQSSNALTLYQKKERERHHFLCMWDWNYMRMIARKEPSAHSMHLAYRYRMTE